LFRAAEQIIEQPVVHNREWIGPGERRLSGQHLVQNNAQRVRSLRLSLRLPFTCSGEI
jgi:hypothetical protein